MSVRKSLNYALKDLQYKGCSNEPGTCDEMSHERRDSLTFTERRLQAGHETPSHI